LEREGLGDGKGAFQLTPKAYRLFQSKLLSRIFSDLAASRSGRHQQGVIGEGSVELQPDTAVGIWRPVSQLDIPATLIDTMLRQGTQRPLRMQARDMEVHRTRNNPRCRTVVLMDMSGSMRYDGQYVNVKRMALALNGLIMPSSLATFCGSLNFTRLPSQCSRASWCRSCRDSHDYQPGRATAG
jgi:uncharacterized protein with von Willebrand factor type A (vWA) domain